MIRTGTILMCLGVVALLFAGCGGGDGGSVPWGAREDLTGRWVLTAGSVNGEDREIAPVVIQIAADGGFQRWEAHLGNWTRGIVLAGGGNIRFEVNEVSPAQARFDGWEGTFTLSNHELTLTRRDDGLVAVEKYSRLRPSIPTAHVGNWLLVASKQDGARVEVDGVVVVSMLGTGQYQVSEQGVGTREVGVMEFSHRSEAVAMVQESAAAPDRAGEIRASRVSAGGGIMRLTSLAAPGDETTLAREIGALDPGAQGVWLRTEIVSGGLRGEGPLGAMGMRMDLADRSGNMLWWDADNPRGQTVNMLITTYAGGYLVLQRTTGGWPSAASDRLRVRLAQAGANPYYAGQWQLLAGQLWLGEGGLDPAYPFEAFANVWDRRATAIPGTLVATWQLHSRTINGQSAPEPAVTLQTRADRTFTRTLGEDEVTQTGQLETYGGRALVFHVTGSGRPEDVGTRLAAHYQVTASELRLVYRDAQERGVVEVYRRS